MGIEIKCGIPASERLESATLTEDYGPRSRRIGVYTKKARPNRQGILFLSLSLPLAHFLLSHDPTRLAGPPGHGR